MSESTVRVLFYHLRWAVCVLALAKIFTIVGAVVFGDVLTGVFEFQTSDQGVDSRQFATELLFWIGVFAGTVAWHVRTTPQGFERRRSASPAGTSARRTNTHVQVR